MWQLLQNASVDTRRNVTSFGVNNKDSKQLGKMNNDFMVLKKGTSKTGVN